MTRVEQAFVEKFDKATWRTWRFDELVENIVERVVPKESGLKKYFGLEHLDTGSLHISRWGDPESLGGDKLKIYEGDLIFAKRNAYLKRVAIADCDAVASAHSMVLRAKVGAINPSFLPFFLLSDYFWSRAIKISVGSLSPTINWKTLAKQEFLLPPKDQQAEIAELLWAMDFSLNAKRSLKQYVERLLVVERSDHFNQEFDQTIKLYDIGEWRSGGTPNRSNQAYWGGQIPWASPKDMKKEVLSSTKENITQAAVKSAKALLPVGSVFVVVRGLILKHTFPVASNSVPMMINQDMRAFILHKDYLSEYVAEFLRFKAEVLLSQCTETTHGTKRLTTDVLYDLEIPEIEEEIQQDYIAKTDLLKECLLQISDAVEADFGLIKSLSASLFNGAT